MTTRISYRGESGEILRNGQAFGRFWVTNSSRTIYGPLPAKNVYHAEINGQQFAGKWGAMKAWVKAHAEQVAETPAATLPDLDPNDLPALTAWLFSGAVA